MRARGENPPLVQVPTPPHHRPVGSVTVGSKHANRPAQAPAVAGPDPPPQPVKPHRSFDPRRVGGLEAGVWVAYYRREWPSFLRGAVSLTRHTFGLPWPSTLYGAWLVLRANQLWAPYPDNDPEGARRAMERFYRLVAERHDDVFDPRRASELEVEWWRVHREHQHDGRRRRRRRGATDRRADRPCTRTSTG